MCQLFALSCNVPSAVTFAFTGFSARGGHTGDHADGFGLAFHDGSCCRLFIDDDRASDSALADFLRHHPIRARTVLAHIRKATQGPVQLSNCHPFVREWQGRHWSFCHNGDLKDFQPRLAGNYLPVGHTDSERAFCWILQELRRRFGTRHMPDWTQMAPVMAELTDRIARHGRFNFLLSDGETLYAHCSTRLFWLQREHPFPTAHLVDHDLALDLSVANGPNDRMVLVATEPLTRNEAWVPFAAGELQVFVAGEAVWRRTGPAPRPVNVVPPERHYAPLAVAL
ncbi:MAG: class II glutamine amidotransferase [Leptothrix sp. (in: b-proteobacteria)]